jgi:acyl-CoA thioester hydrolase
MTTIATYRGAVYPWHCDHVGHMNVMWYVGKFDEASWGLFADIGLGPSCLRDSRRGLAAVQQAISYRQEVLAGDIVAVDALAHAVEAGRKSWSRP